MAWYGSFCLHMANGFASYFLFLLVIGTFKLTIEFTEEYPNKPPTVRFVSKMFHPNGKFYISKILVLHLWSMCQWTVKSNCISLCSVYADGSICLDILQNRWSPTYDVSSILTSIQVWYVCTFFTNYRVPIQYEIWFSYFPRLDKYGKKERWVFKNVCVSRLLAHFIF